MSFQLVPKLVILNDLDAALESMDGRCRVASTTVQIQLRVISVTVDVHTMFRGHILKVCCVQNYSTA